MRSYPELRVEAVALFGDGSDKDSVVLGVAFLDQRWMTSHLSVMEEPVVELCVSLIGELFLPDPGGRSE